MKIQSKICSLCQMTKSDKYGSINTSTKEKYEEYLRNLSYEMKVIKYKRNKKPRKFCGSTKDL